MTIHTRFNPKEKFQPRKDILGDGGVDISSKNSKLAVKAKSLVESTKTISVDCLELSPKNPRLRGFGDKLTQEQIRKILKDEFEARSLRKRILEDGQVYEDIWVQWKGNKFIVHEGSTRVVAVLLILEDIKSGKLQGTTENDWKKISCKVIRANATEAEIREFLTQIHVAGKDAWVTLSNAAQVYAMIEEDGKTYQSVADHLGKSKLEVEKLHKAFEKTLEFGKKHNSGNYMRSFVYWLEFFSKANLQDEAQRDPNFTDQLMIWMSDGKIINHKEMRGIDKWYAEGVKPAHRNKALAEINKSRGTAKNAIELFHDLSLEGTLGVIDKAKRILKTYKVSSLSKADGKDILKSLEELTKEIKNIKKVLGKFSTEGASAA